MLKSYLTWRADHWVQALAVAVVSTGLATAVRGLIGIFAPDAVPFAVYFIAVLVTSFVGGRRAGFMALGLSAIVSTYFFVAPRYSLSLSTESAAVNLALFVAVGLAIIVVMEALRRVIDRAVAAERRLSLAQEAGKLGDWRWNLDTNRISWSDNLFRLMDLDPAFFEPTPEAVERLVHPDERAAYSSALRKTIQQDTRFEWEKRILLADDTIRYVISRGEMERNEAGQAIALRGTDIDITNLREAELALSKTMQRYRMLFEAMSEAYVVHELVYDEDGRAIDFRAIEANSAFETMTGIPLGKVVGRLASEFAPGGDPAWLHFFADVVRSGKAGRMERYSPRAGRWIDLRAFPLGGARLGATFSDVTERKEAELARQVAELRLNSAIKVAGIGVFERDLATDLISTSASFDALFEMEEHLPTRPIADYLARVEPSYKALIVERIGANAKPGSTFEVEYEIRVPDGRTKWISSKSAVVEDGMGRRRAVGAVVDISARKANEAEQELARRRAETMFREMNHRIKNNLTIVGSLLTLQASRAGNSELATYLTAARERVQTIAGLHENLYQNPELGDVDCANYVNNICARIRSSLAAHVPIEWEIKADPVIVSVDVAVPLGLIVNELATNAVKHAFSHCQEGNVCRIEISLTRHNGRVRLCVADNGCGLPDGSRSGSRGLGSRLIDAFVKQVDGVMTVQVSKGTRFEIVFSAGRDAEAA